MMPANRERGEKAATTHQRQVRPQSAGGGVDAAQQSRQAMMDENVDE